MKYEKTFTVSSDAEISPLQETCYKITGCAIDILNSLGPGLSRDVYSACLKIEMERRGIEYVRNCAAPLIYAGKGVGEIEVAFVADNRLAIEIFVSENFNETEHSRYYAYLRALNLPMILLLNFQFGKLQWKKIAADRV